MSIPISPDCNDFMPMDGEYPFNVTAHRAQPPDCASCIYFSRRNCGKDTEGPDNYLFDQTIL